MGATGVVAVLLLLITQVVGGGGDGSEAQAVRLEPVSYTPPDAFTPSVAEGPSTPGPEPFPVEPASAGAVRSAPAGTAGLYGGSLNQSSCNREKLVGFLEGDPAKAQAWVGALNADPTLVWSSGTRVGVQQIRDYVFELTPVILRADTWVTNHGFANGRPTAIQSVLQAGTAVLVDSYGVPRVKCYCGNPLLPPRRFPPVYKGPRWPGFNPGTVVVIEQSITIIDVFVLTNVQTGEPLSRPPSTDGPDDAPGPPGSTPAPGLTVPPDVQLGTGDVQVTLLWTSGDDLDLHVVDPTGFELYFSTARAPATSPSGGQLDVDDTAGCDGASATHVENVFWPEGGAPTGEFSAYVRNYRGCDAPASFQLRVTVAGTVVHDESGSLSGGESSPPVPFSA